MYGEDIVKKDPEELTGFKVLDSRKWFLRMGSAVIFLRIHLLLAMVRYS